MFLFPVCFGEFFWLCPQTSGDFGCPFILKPMGKPGHGGAYGPVVLTLRGGCRPPLSLGADYVSVATGRPSWAGGFLERSPQGAP